MMNKKTKILIIGLAAVLVILCMVLIFIQPPQSQKEDYRAIASEEYNTVFLSMYPVDTYYADDFAYYRGLTAFKASYCIPDLSTLRDYLKRISKSENSVFLAYLGIRPDKVDLQQLATLLGLYPDISFEVILSHPALPYWQQLAKQDYEQTLSAYQELLDFAPSITGANFYFYGSQAWLISNPANYEDQWLTTEDISRTIMLNSDAAHSYLVTAENASLLSVELETLTKTARTQAKAYPDLSDRCIVFWGDSVIGNYTDSTSIPGAVAGLTGATVYNCGYGGNSAALGPDMLVSLPAVVNAFFTEDLSSLPDDTQVYAGTASYLQDAPEDKKMCYVINYGLNDYFSGYPVCSEDPYDITTFSGALRTAVSTIRTYDPDAQIILCTPTFVGLFENGTEPHGEAGNVLTDYVQAVLDLAPELQVDVLDNYNGLGIDPENITVYLGTDLVHPNLAGRFAIAEGLTALMR